MTSPPSDDGFLPLDKPVGPTSHDIVAAVRRTFGVRGVGHTGTLDPFASGLLLLCLGRATRLAEYLSDWPKEYAARARLGVRTTTDDLEGEPIAESRGWETLSRDEIASALAAFLGESEQRPPDFSAKKVGGRSAYALARRGEEVVLAPSRIAVHAIELTAFDLPWVEFRVKCSTGTYVRAIARDLGDSLGVGAHLTGLRRLAIGPFRVEDALSLDDLSDPTALEAGWITPLEAVAHLPHVEVTADEARKVRLGQALSVEEGRVEVQEGESDLVLSSDGELVAMARLEGDLLRPRKVFHA